MLISDVVEIFVGGWCGLSRQSGVVLSGIEDISDSKEEVDNINNFSKQIGVTNNSENLIVDGSDPKSDSSGATHTTNRISATHATNRISKQKLHPLFIIPVIQDVETRSGSSCGSPSFVFTSVSPM